MTLLKDPITDKKDSMDQNTPRLISSEKIIELSKNTTIFRDLGPTTWKFQSETFTSDKRKRVVNLKSLKWILPDFKRLNKVTKEATDPRGKSDFLSATYIPNQLDSEAMFPSVRGTGGSGPKERDKETKSFYSDRKTIPLVGKDYKYVQDRTQKRKLVPANDLRLDIPFKMLDKFEPDICIGQNGAFGSSSAPFHQHFQLFLKKFLPVYNPDICSNPISILEVFLFIKKDEISQNSEGRKLWEYIGIYPSLGMVGSIGTDDKYIEYERAMDSRAPEEEIKLKISDILKNAR